MSILAIDYGAKKIGLAKSDDQNKFALPLGIISHTSKPATLAVLKKTCAEHAVEKIVVGVPVSFQSGGKKTFWRQVDLQNEQMKEVLSFIHWLKDEIDLPIEIEDERLSSKMAGGLLRGTGNKGADDHVAAMLILQTYLDRQQHDVNS
ncbi:MAG: Holliday junction resolvase RuvX [Candidatus Buchananbacteria bacterium]|nr:Holliday junction resolvase RuvX [Candidatus Buchananbacteria bacterium]